VTGQATETPAAPEAGPPDSPAPSSPLSNRVVRLTGLSLFAGLMVGFTVIGKIALPLAVLVILPGTLAMALAEAGRARESGWARVAAVVGLVVWVAVIGGLPMLLVVFAILFSVFLHELGHYLAARRAGIKATEFFIGFGPRLWSFRWGETEFGLKPILAGAYVRILGMNNLEDVDPADEARTYRQAPFHSRVGVALAGVGMNFALAIVLLFVQFAFVGSPDTQHWSVASVTPRSPAAVAGIEKGDRFVSFDGRPVGTYEAFRKRIAASPAGPVDLVVDRNGTERALNLDLARKVKVIGTVGDDVDLIDARRGVIVGGLSTNGRGEQAGLGEGDSVTEVNGQPVTDTSDVPAAVRASKGGQVRITVAPTATSTPRTVTVDLGSKVGTTAPIAFLGVGSQPDLVRESVPAAVGSSFSEFGRGIGATVGGVAQIFYPPNIAGFVSSTLTGSDRDVTGAPTPRDQVGASSDASRPTSIIGAIAFGADITKEHLSNLIVLLVALNVFFGVFNLIPLLPLDGGHVAIAVYEKAHEVRRRQKSRYIADITNMLPIAYMVIMVLAVVGGLSIFLDITRGVST